MKTTIQSLVTLIGEREAIGVLQNHIVKQWSAPVRITEGFTVKEVGLVKKGKRRILGSRRWTPADRENFKNRVAILRDQGRSYNKICNMLAPEFHRTPSSIWNQIGKLRRINK